MLNVWLDWPRRFRAERVATIDGRALRLCTRGTLRDGFVRHWKDECADMIAGKPIKQGYPAPSSTDVDRLFNLEHIREVMGALVIQSAQPTSTGRSRLLVRAHKRKGDSHNRLWPHWLPFGADEYLLTFDLEQGHMLSFAGLADGQEFERSEVTDITYGEAFDDSLFTLA